ncbi:hypothetical protein J2800_004811 [Caulobacter rhizosphaerae]|uniref:Uncharacterized protein n=1 Tax=Caulobacter rhizosphaerae TaxID=2010972 RepID=A0ABU1N7J4_9CAUL|nr:hypothetical protein [Caulobacter rhizosphaerae]
MPKPVLTARALLARTPRRTAPVGDAAPLSVAG